MRITVLGSGTSGGVPTIGCDCAVCRSDAPENKRLRCSLYVEVPAIGDVPEAKFLIDCSSDFRQQALRYRLPRIDAVAMTHDHADHMNGLDDLRAYNFIQRGPIDVYGDATVLATIRRCYDYCFNPKQIGGGVPQLRPRGIVARQAFRIGALEVTPVPIWHGQLPILGFRLGRHFAYLTDCSRVDEDAMDLLKDLRVLIVGALRPRPHPTHFSLDQAVAFSRRVAPSERTWFTHMTCNVEHFATNAALAPATQLLHDGQTIEVPDD